MAKKPDKSLYGKAVAGRTPPTPNLNNVNAMVGRLFGRTRRGGKQRPNYDAAAAHYGVTPRTVQRWAKTPPKRSEKLEALRTDTRAWAHSPAGRRAQLPKSREAALKKHGASVRLSGEFRVSNDVRSRSINHVLDTSATSDVVDAWLRHGDKGAHDAIEDVLRRDYFAFDDDDSITVSGAFDELDIRPRNDKGRQE